jgi:putative spermidine/putrescine transport system permease protein
MQHARSIMRGRGRVAIALAPFLLFLAAFLFWPATSIIVESVLDRQRNLTLANLMQLGQPFIMASFVYTMQLSAVTAVGGGMLGLMLAYATVSDALPPALRDAMTTFCGVASNFAGVPLAFAFIATLGQLGVVTQWLRGLGIAIYPSFSLYGFWGLCLTYLYFQIPLMTLVMAPAIAGLRREWREAATSLGASAATYWWRVALPILMPSILATTALLFGNAFGAHATAFALTGGGSQTSVVTILIGAQISSDALANPGLGNALALGMIVVMTLAIGASSALSAVAARWTR